MTKSSATWPSPVDCAFAYGSTERKELTKPVAVSRRGVVFFRNQSINSDEQKVLGQKLGELTGKPATSKVSFA
jgi:alpha-ketoglutarate-dependent taurine dioxygenase